MLRYTGWLAVAALIAVMGCRQSSSNDTTATTSTGSASSGAAVATPSSDAPGDAATPGAKEVTMPSGLKYVDLKVGDGALAESGKSVSVHYTGWLTDGTKFDSSVDRGRPFTFTLGAGQVIRGWDEGVAGMRIGGKRKLTIPSELGYGPAGTPGGPIPPNATLLFDVELLSVR